MARRISITLALAATTAVAFSNGAFAGGLEANGYNWDHLFASEAFAARGTISYVMIDQDIQNAGGDTVAESTDRVYYNYGFKADFGDTASCLVSTQNPFGSGTKRDFAYAATSPGGAQSVSERITSNDVGLTCAYGFDVGPGVLSVIGGISGQSIDYKARLPLPTGLGLPVSAVVDLDGEAIGWRAGVAYEVPEIALRVSAIYNAAIDYDLSGTFDPLGQSLRSDVTTPQSFEIKGQTGFAPGWLVLGSVKWVDWSVLDTLTVNGATVPGLGVPLPISTALNYEDGWTVTAGVGHALTEELSVLGSLTWDKGTSREDDTGVLVSGTQTDRLGASLGASYTVAKQFELSGGASYSVIDGGSNARGETWDGGNVFAVSANLKASF